MARMNAPADHLCGKLHAADLTRRHYRVDGRLDHVTWVRNGGPIAARIADWWQQVQPGEEPGSAPV